MPKVSVITINYNNAAGLQKTMESVFTQTFSDFEYIIIDGESTDGSKKLVEDNQSKLTYWVSEKDNGVYNAMNKGIIKASGDYLLFLNSGDYFYNKKSLEEIAEKVREYDLVYGNMIIDDGAGFRRQTYPARLDFDYFFSGMSLPHHSTLIKRSLFEKAGLYNEQNKITSDWEFFINAVCLYGASYKYTDVDVSVYKLDGLSSHPASAEIYVEEKQKTYDRYYAAFLPLIERNKEYERQLRLIKSSRFYQIVERITSKKIYKSLKKNLRF